MRLKQAVCKAFGSVELVVGPYVAAQLAPGSCRIRVSSAGVNFADQLQVNNQYQEKRTPPFVAGFEAYGQVVESSCKIGAGSWVLASQPGAFSSMVDAPESHVFPLGAQPARSHVEAAALLVTYGTAQLALQTRARLRPNEWVLVTAASGGVGSAAIQLAKLQGAKVIAAAGSRAKLENCLKLGADAVLDYSALASAGGGKLAVRDVRDALLQATNNAGVDVALDMVGGDAFFEGVCRSMRFGGRLCVIGFASGEIPRAKTNLALVRNFDVCGVYWGGYFQQGPAAIASLQQGMGQVLEFYEQGKLTPLVSKVFPLRDADQALRAVADRATAGKVVIEM